MTRPQYIDVSGWQADNTINWPQYAAWAKSFDGTSRVCMKVSEGVSFRDPSFDAHYAGAIRAGIDRIIYYHYARPQNDPIAEAEWFKKSMGTVGAGHDFDLIMLDLEEVGSNTAEWAFRWLSDIHTWSNRLPILYASDSFIRAHLQDARLAQFPLVLANWQFDPNENPPCPPPWTHYEFLQWSDKATVPGVGEAVDCNLFCGVDPAPTPPPPPPPPVINPDIAVQLQAASAAIQTALTAIQKALSELK